MLNDVQLADIGLIGLAVMGQNLVLNMNDHGYSVAVYNRTVSKVDEFVNGPAAGTRVVPARSLSELAACLKRPRQAGHADGEGRPARGRVHRAPAALPRTGRPRHRRGQLPLRRHGRRPPHPRATACSTSGRESAAGRRGARHGPSIMPGGMSAAWPLVKDIFQSIAAKAADGTPCCDWVGEDGAGHYVKMIHNGIEYGDMQLIAEAYDLLRDVGRLSHAEMHRIFADWNAGQLESYLIEITRDIMRVTDADGQPLVEKILDTAGQKGTAVDRDRLARPRDPGDPHHGGGLRALLSAFKEERVHAARTSERAARRRGPSRRASWKTWRRALLAAKTGLVHPGVHAAARSGPGVRLEPGLRTDRAPVARRVHHPQCFPRPRSRPPSTATPTWPACSGPVLPARARAVAQAAWRRVVARAARTGIPIPAFGAALSLLRRYRSRAAARQPHPGPARLFRRPHLRARRPAARGVLPHPVDGGGRMSAGTGGPEARIPAAEVASILAAGVPERLFAGAGAGADAGPDPDLPAAQRGAGRPRGLRTGPPPSDFMVAVGTHTPLDETGHPAPLRDRPAIGPPRHLAASSATLGPAGHPGRVAGWRRRRWRASPRGGCASGSRSTSTGGARLRPGPDRRAGVPARGRRVLRRGQVPLPRGSRAASFLHFFHWLGAVITCADHRRQAHAGAAADRPRDGGACRVPVRCLAMVVRPDASLRGLFVGDAGRPGRRPPTSPPASTS